MTIPRPHAHDTRRALAQNVFRDRPTTEDHHAHFPTPTPRTPKLPG